MSIIASAHVPAHLNLSTAPTLGIRIPQQRTTCPNWCTVDHSGEPADVDGFTLGVAHDCTMVELPAKDPAWVNRPATATVLIESTTEAGVTVTAPRVVLTLAEGAEGGHPGEQDVQGWTASPEQVETLALALLDAARIARQAVTR